MKSNERKKLLRSANNHLKDASELIEIVADDLKLSLAFVPENLKSGAQYEKREANIDRLLVSVDEIMYASNMLSDFIK